MKPINKKVRGIQVNGFEHELTEQEAQQMGIVANDWIDIIKSGGTIKVTITAPSDVIEAKKGVLAFARGRVGAVCMWWQLWCK